MHRVKTMIVFTGLSCVDAKISQRIAYAAAGSLGILCNVGKVPPTRLERATYGLGGRCSIRLSYEGNCDLRFRRFGM